jgi:hypothetical protein
MNEVKIFREGFVCKFPTDTLKNLFILTGHKYSEMYESLS